MKFLFTFLILGVLNSISFAQYRNLNIKLGEYTFITKYDTATFYSTLIIKKNAKTIFKDTSEFPVMDINEYDLDGNGEKEILLDLYSGGAHCCTYLLATQIINDKFTILDSIYWGNSFYKIEDINGDGKYEIVGVNDMFAYAFTNYAQSEFNILICGFENNKFINVTKNFPELIEKDIEVHLNSLKQYTTDTGFACPKNINDDTFNTDAGAVKAVLAPIVADYFTLGEVNKGYQLVDSVYRCVDKDKFIQTLQNEYKLK